MPAVDTPVTALFDHLCSFASVLEKDLVALNRLAGHGCRTLPTASGLPILQHIDSTTAAAAQHVDSMLGCCNPSMRDILQLCGQIYQENEMQIDMVEKELQRYGYRRVCEDRSTLYQYNVQPTLAGSRRDDPSTTLKQTVPPPAPVVSDILDLYNVEQTAPRTPTLEDCGGISTTALALLSARHGPKTPVMEAALAPSDAVTSLLQADVTRKLFEGDGSRDAVNKTDVSLAMEVEDSTLTASVLLNHSTIHPLVEEISQEEFERDLPSWLQELMGKDAQVVNRSIRLINDYVSEKWFQMDEESKQSVPAYFLSKEELERLVGLPEKTSKGLLLCLKALRRLVARQHGAETQYFLK